MTLRKSILFAVAAASLAAPGALAAQEYDTYPADRGAADAGNFVGYEEFRGAEATILWQIDRGVHEDRLTPREARDFRDDLQKIQDDEARGFRFYGWRPPVELRDDIRYALGHLSREIDDEAEY